MEKFPAATRIRGGVVAVSTSLEFPELAWLKREFSLDENQYDRIKSLHLKQDQLCVSMQTNLNNPLAFQ